MQNRRKKEEKIEICTKCEQNLIKFIKCFKIRKKLFTNQKKGGILTFVLKKRHSFKMPGFDLGGEIIMKKNLVAKNELGIYADGNGVVRADSLVVAKIFEKRHDNVVRDIRNLDCSEEFRLLNFEESSYTNLQGHRQACFNMTRDGFVFLVMGYRGKKAASFKEAYIKRFLYSVRSHSL